MTITANEGCPHASFAPVRRHLNIYIETTAISATSIKDLYHQSMTRRNAVAKIVNTELYRLSPGREHWVSQPYRRTTSGLYENAAPIFKELYPLVTPERPEDTAHEGPVDSNTDILVYLYDDK